VVDADDPDQQRHIYKHRPVLKKLAQRTLARRKERTLVRAL
jgi:hypothetical protein